MARIYSISYLTAQDYAPPQLVNLAAELGYDAVGLRVLPAAKGAPFWPLVEDAALLKATRERLAATGIKVLDAEIVWLTPDFDVKAHEAFLAMCAALGVRAILAGGADKDLGRLTASYAALCEAARPFGIAIDVEFMPWTAIPNVKAAAQIVRDAGQENGGVLVDALHFMRSGAAIDEIAAMPREWFHYTQICDAPAAPPATTEGLIHAARFERLLPGEGGAPLSELFAAMPRELPISIEIPNAKIVGEIGSKEWARRALAASKRVVERADRVSEGQA